MSAWAPSNEIMPALMVATGKSFDDLFEVAGRKIVARDHAGTTIKAMRTALDLSREELARLADVDQGYLSRVESGDRSPSRPWMRDVSQALVNEMTRQRGGAA